MILTWNNDIGFIDNNAANYHIKVKPALGFVFDSIFYEEATNNKMKVVAGETIILSDTEILQTKNYIASYDFSFLTKHFIDALGNYVGMANEEGVTEVPFAPPVGDYYVWNGAEYNYIHAADVGGNYIGNAKLTAEMTLVPLAPSTKHDIWNGTEWVDGREVADVITEGEILIDKAAGKTRAKYITAVEGQSETYTEKAKQAEAYSIAVNPNILDYGLINAELNAVQTVNPDITAGEIVAFILGTRDQWMVLAASIEGERRKGKLILAEQTDSGAAVGVINNALAVLAAL